MKEVTTREELLVDCASRGDAAAFYTLFEQQLSLLYVNQCSRGKNGADAIKELVPFAVEAYRDFIGNQPEDAEQWFDLKAQSASGHDGQSASEEQEITREINRSGNLDLFKREIQLALQREFGALSRKNAQKKDHRNTRIKPLRRSKWPLIVSTIIAAGIIICIVLFLTKITLTFTLTSNSRVFSFSLPWALNYVALTPPPAAPPAELSSDTPVGPQNALPQQNGLSSTDSLHTKGTQPDTGISDSIRSAKKVVTAAVRKKITIQRESLSVSAVKQQAVPSAAPPAVKTTQAVTIESQSQQSLPQSPPAAEPSLPGPISPAAPGNEK